LPTPAHPERPRAWKKARRRKSDSPLLRQRGRGWGWGPIDKVFFPRAERVIAATRLRTARELWDLVSPSSTQTAATLCLQVSGSRLFVRRLQIDRPPSRARWRKALQFNNLGAVIAFMYLFYLLVALGITVPVLLIAFCLDIPDATRSLIRRLRRQHRRRQRGWKPRR
jgi:hypothetical protein